MSPGVQIGSILLNQSQIMKDSLAVETEPYSGEWALVRLPNGFGVNGRVYAAGWKLLFMAGESKAIVLGALGPKTIQKALQRILTKVRPQRFNGLEVTGLFARHFLGVPYAVVTAHSRHLQQSWCLDSVARRIADFNVKPEGT
jgi:hypothetical protein